MHLGALLSWGLIFQAIAIVHFIQRRPAFFWLWIIIFFGPIGAGIYIAVEVVPDLGLLRGVVDAFGRRKRIRALEATVQQNPAAGNFEELADLYLEEGHYARARESYDRAIAGRIDHPDPLYRRGIAEIHLGDFTAAVRDLEEVTRRDPKYDSYRAMGLLAHAYAKTGESSRADRLFRQATETSTASETFYNYASLLADEGRHDEAREFASRILSKKATLPRYLRRLERPWFRKATTLIKRLPAASATTRGGAATAGR